MYVFKETFFLPFKSFSLKLGTFFKSLCQQIKIGIWYLHRRCLQRTINYMYIEIVSRGEDLIIKALAFLESPPQSLFTIQSFKLTSFFLYVCNLCKMHFM